MILIVILGYGLMALGTIAMPIFLIWLLIRFISSLKTKASPNPTTADLNLPIAPHKGVALQPNPASPLISKTSQVTDLSNGNIATTDEDDPPISGSVLLHTFSAFISVTIVAALASYIPLLQHPNPFLGLGIIVVIPALLGVYGSKQLVLWVNTEQWDYQRKKKFVRWLPAIYLMVLIIASSIFSSVDAWRGGKHSNAEQPVINK
jgi:hypothetical protein